MQVLTSEDAQLQARIWNKFVKQRPFSNEAEGPYYVTAEILDNNNTKFRSSSEKSDATTAHLGEEESLSQSLLLPPESISTPTTPSNSTLTANASDIPEQQME